LQTLGINPGVYVTNLKIEIQAFHDVFGNNLSSDITYIFPCDVALTGFDQI
jgi:hypothetical protein